MTKYTLLFFAASLCLFAETLFEVKDASNNKVLDVSTDGLRVMNQGDTLMVISSAAIKANISNSKGLSRSFSVTTNSSKGSGTDLMRLTSDSTRFWISDTGSGFGVASQTSAKEKSVATNFLKVSNANTEMREGEAGGRYTDFSPNNIFLGLNAGIATTPGDPNLFSGKRNLFFGNDCGKSNISGAYNIMIGDNCGKNNTTGGTNLFIGNNSGELNTSGGWNLFIGHGSGAKNTADNNMFAGHNAGATNSIGISNLFVGTDAGAYNSSGSSNVFVGQQTGIYNESGDNNTFLGNWAGNNNVYSDDNTFVGQSAGKSQNAGNQNTYIGSMAGKEKSLGYSNTLIGYGAGQKNGTGDSNTMLGYMSGWNSTGSRNVFLGLQAGYSETGSDKLYIDNSSTSAPLIYGDFSTNAITVNGTLNTTGAATMNSTLNTSGNATFNSYTGMGVAPNSNYRLYAVDDYIGVRTYVSNSAGSHTYGVYGEARNATTANYGLYGYAYSTTGSQKIGVYGYAGTSGPCYAGYFNGHVYVTGDLYANDYIEFKSDHPLDPENKYLNHSAVSSNEVKNIYDGVTNLDVNGKATVSIPDWFEAYNSNFRYQITAIGMPCPNIYISKKISGGNFEISGGEPGAEICWQVTGVRNDNYAKANPMMTETYKTGTERGLYVNPEAFGFPEEKGIGFIHNKEISKAEK